MTDTVLLVDDEQCVLNSVFRLFSGNGYKVLMATSADEALTFFSHEKIAVLVSGNVMPGRKGIDLLSKVKEVSPDTLKILMTAQEDLTTAIDAIHKGEIFRFITKPWDDRFMIRVVDEALRRYQLIQSLRSMNESTVFSLAQGIELKDSYTRGHCERVATYALMIAEKTNLSEEKKKDIKFGSWLHDCGKIGIHENILTFKGPLDHDKFEIIKNHPRWGADIARQAHMSDTIVNIILHHHERYEGNGYPTGVSETDIPFEARIVTVADIYDALTSDRSYRGKYSVEKALNIMQLMKGNVLDPELFDIFLHDCLNIQHSFELD